MKKIIVLLLALFMSAGCAVNPVTGRKQLNLVKESDLQLSATSQYKTFLSQNKVLDPAVNKDAAMVKRVGTRIADAITKFYTDQGKGSVLEGYNWEFNTVESNEVNAWCMPGGKVVVYTGLLPVTQNETALAIVLGHEITHAVAKHGNERLSEALIQQMGGQALDVALSQKPKETQDLIKQAYGVGSQVGVMLPFSRQQETEADHFGLIFAAMAGYNPQEAVPFWQRMAAMGGTKPPELLSTHPADQTRINDLKKVMPEAQQYYHPDKK